MFRCNIPRCAFYWRPPHTYYPGLVWAPLFDSIEAVSENLEMYAGFAHRHLRDNTALLEEYNRDIACQNSAHAKHWLFQESGIEFFYECSDELCSRSVAIKIAARPDIDKLVQAVKYCSDNHNAVRRAHQDRHHPLYLRIRNTTEKIRSEISIPVGFAYTRFFPYSVSDTRSERIDIDSGLSFQLLEAFMNNMCSNFSLANLNCPQHCMEAEDPMNGVE